METVRLFHQNDSVHQQAVRVTSGSFFLQTISAANSKTSHTKNPLLRGYKKIMMNSKKTLALLLVAVMFCALTYGGCGGSSNMADPVDTSGGTSQPVS